MMRRHLVMVLLVALLAHLTFAERYALLVGNSSAPGNYAPLKYVQNDIGSIKDILSSHCGFDKTRIITLYNGTPDDLRQALAGIAAQLKAPANNLFFFYYSGHAEATGLKMGAQEYTFDSLKQQLDAFPSDIRIGVFDACQSGNFTRLKGGWLAEPFLFKDDSKTQGQVILCSSSINENAQESDNLQRSVFTFHFVNALRGSADISGDARVTMSEAYHYAYNRTISSTAGSAGGVQHPSYQFRIQGEGDIVLADLNVSSRGILLGPDILGDVTIISNAASVVADLTKEKNSAIMIALSSGVYRVLCGQGGKRYQANAEIKDNVIVRLRQTDFSPVRSDSSRNKGITDEPLQFGLCIGGAYGRYDFGELAAGLERRFSGSDAFSMQPVFSFPSGFPMLNLAGEIVALRHLVGTLGFSASSGSSSAHYTGSHPDAAASGSYKTTLQVDYSIAVSVVDLGIGYRFSKRYVKNSSIHGGLLFHRARASVSSIFTDSLYNIYAMGSGSNTVTVAVPYIAIGYRYPIMRWLDIGVKGRYRYHESTVDGNDDNSLEHPASAQYPAPLQYRFDGIDGNLYLNFHFPPGLLEKLL